MRKRTLFLIIGAILTVIVIVAVVLVLDYTSESSETKTVRAFLQDAIEGKENAALTYLSPGLKEKVRQECPGSLVTKCFARLISPSWGKLVDIAAAAWSSTKDAMLFHTQWTNLPGELIPIVIFADKASGAWLITGWRGFVRIQSEAEEG